MNPIAEDILMHYGVGKMEGAPGRGSGRYPLGSGKNPNQHSGDFLSRVETMRKSGMSETQIAEALGMTTTQLRVQKSLAKDERRSQEVATARRLRDEGYSLNEIGKDGIQQRLLDPFAAERKLRVSHESGEDHRGISQKADRGKRHDRRRRWCGA